MTILSKWKIKEIPTLTIARRENINCTVFDYAIKLIEHYVPAILDRSDQTKGQPAHEEERTIASATATEDSAARRKELAIVYRHCLYKN